MKKFYLFFGEGEIVQRSVGQIEKVQQAAGQSQPAVKMHQVGAQMGKVHHVGGQTEIVPHAVGQIPQTVEIVQLSVAQTEIVPRGVAQIPWRSIRLILDKIKRLDEANFYIQKTIEHSWSRAVLSHQIALKLYTRQGKMLSNFEITVPRQDVDLLKSSFKDSYVLDFLGLTEDAKEKDLETALINNISKFILELGKGFAFIGKEYKLTVGGQEFFVDLLFYNYILRRFVVVELKTTDFKPEYSGQIEFYMTAIDRDIKTEGDKSTIGLIICKSKNNTVVEYALSSSLQPTGVAEYKLFSELPEEFKRYLPSEEELKEKHY
jgi:predicted nuclease of restriction endonuclease-like (RecB) superfamily